MTARYRIPSPKCRHARKGIVTTGVPMGQGHASTQVCDRAECIADAIEWARAVSGGKDADYIPDGAR